MSRMLALACVFAAFALAAGSASAQQPSGTSQQPAPTPPYGPPITLEQAKRVMAAAELEAAKNSWQVAVTILDSGGNMVMFHKLDNTQLASIGVSEGKANTALRFKRPSKALDDVIAAGGAGLRLLAVKDITPLEGGLPVILDGTIIGAIGVSGRVSPRRTRRWRGRAQCQTCPVLASTAAAPAPRPRAPVPPRATFFSERDLVAPKEPPYRGATGYTDPGSPHPRPSWRCWENPAN
jgi:uncharacterized protein GlcG (DUF336 family)